MKTCDLKTLIEMALAGKRFKAKCKIFFDSYTQKDFDNGVSWTPTAITAAWEYEEVREPRVIWVNDYSYGLNKLWHDNKKDADLNSDHNRIACRKFVEVME